MPSAVRNTQSNAILNADLPGDSCKVSTQEKKREYNPEDLKKVVGKRKGVGLGAGLEYRQFVSKYSHTVSGDNFKSQLRSEAFLNPGGARAQCPRKGSRLKRMQNRNFVVTIFQNLMFIPAQAFHRLFAA
jgi:hypothetical protein